MLGLLTPPCLPLSLTPSPPPSLTPPYSLSEPLPAFLSLTPPSLSSLSDPPLYLSLCLSVLSHICQGPDGCREAELRSRRRRAGGEASGKAPESGWRDETRTPGALKLQANLRCFVGPFPPMSLVSAVGGQGVEALGGPPHGPCRPTTCSPQGRLCTPALIPTPNLIHRSAPPHRTVSPNVGHLEMCCSFVPCPLIVLILHGHRWPGRLRLQAHRLRGRLPWSPAAAAPAPPCSASDPLPLPRRRAPREAA